MPHMETAATGGCPRPEHWAIQHPPQPRLCCNALMLSALRCHQCTGAPLRHRTVFNNHRRTLFNHHYHHHHRAVFNHHHTVGHNNSHNHPLTHLPTLTRSLTPLPHHSCLLTHAFSLTYPLMCSLTYLPARPLTHHSFTRSQSLFHRSHCRASGSRVAPRARCPCPRRASAPHAAPLFARNSSPRVSAGRCHPSRSLGTRAAHPAVQREGFFLTAHGLAR